MFQARSLLSTLLCSGRRRVISKSILSKCTQYHLIYESARSLNVIRGKIAEKHAGTMSEVSEKMTKRLGLEKGYSPIPRSREELKKYEPKETELPPRSMEDSYTSATIPLSTDKELQDKYVTVLGNVRIGRLLEDMDLFAVWVVHQHVQVPNLPENIALPYTFVTVLVDKVTFDTRDRKVDKDILISGHVSWVGRSTLEIVVWLEQIVDGTKIEMTTALFLMAARNATNTGALIVNPLKPSNEEEEEIFSGGQERKKRRKLISETSIFKVEPNDFEQTLMYNMYKRTTDSNSMELNKRILPKNCCWMSNSFAVNTVSAFPEHRNAHNSVFGGFLMRSALELSWVAASLYCHERPVIIHMLDISFEKPVSVNSFLKMVAYIVYTEANYITVMTVIDAIDAVKGDQNTTNVFHTVLQAKDYVPEVIPRSYQETMWYIQGRRKFRNSMGID